MPSDFLNAVKYWLPKQNWIYTKKMYEGRKSARKKGWSFAHTSTIATLPPNSIFYLLIRLPPPLPSILNTFVAAASAVFLAYQYLWQIQIKTFCVPFDSLQFLKWTQFRVSNERGVSIPLAFVKEIEKHALEGETSSLAVKTINSMTNTVISTYLLGISVWITSINCKSQFALNRVKDFPRGVGVFELIHTQITSFLHVLPVLQL